MRPLYLLVGYQIASNTSALLYVHRPFLVDLVKSINTGLAQSWPRPQSQPTQYNLHPPSLHGRLYSQLEAGGGDAHGCSADEGISQMYLSRPRQSVAVQPIVLLSRVLRLS